MSKERMAGAIKVGFARMRVDYTETVIKCPYRSRMSTCSAQGKCKSGNAVDAVCVREAADMV